MTGIDVGAHKGVVLRWIVAAATGGRHWAFEPLPEYATELRAKFSQVAVMELALSDHSGESTFQHVKSHPGFSGLRRRPYPFDHPEIEELTVRVDTLDNIIGKDQAVHFMKIDVEGGELGVLRGAHATILRSQPYIVFEHGRPAAAGYGATSEEIFDLLTKCGLEVSKLDAWLAGRESLTRSGFSRNPEWMYLAHPN